ncbi:MAG: Sulfate/thiosulfate import ATP-binding protein CysA [Firmicutes bacterium ADurb.Bin456]|nr:MAG: Sulfate/thiosulfate import ATP-binding protein CysA [Firmicutes bacterium ADurb.Bin456]
MPEIIISNIQKTLAGLLTLREINLTVTDSTVAGVLGPSGCGKSTLFNIISGLMKPDRGSISIGGLDVTGKTGLVSYMHQKDLLLPSLDVLDNVSIPLVLKGTPRKKARAEAAGHLGTFGLAGFESYYPSQLSGGMRQRAAMLRTYLFSSDIWLLDEPFASLDAITKRKMHTWLTGVLEQIRPTVLFITLPYP